MWRRWGNREPGVQDPVQPFITLDEEENYLETIPEVDSRPQSTARLPDLPFRSVPPLHQLPQRESVYSQASPPLPPTIPQSQNHDLTVDTSSRYLRESSEISPLSERGSYYEEDHVTTREVSPIEAVAPINIRGPRPEPKPQRTISRKQPATSPKENIKREQTKWDEYSGEPTKDDKGKPGSARPGTTPVEMQFPHLKERTKQILAGLREREAVKNQLTKKTWEKPSAPVNVDPLDNPPQREPWKGASGRTTLVEPVKNTPAARTGVMPANSVPVTRKQSVQQPVQESVQQPVREPIQIQAPAPAAMDEPLSTPSPPRPTIRTIQSEESLRAPSHIFVRKPVGDSAPPTASLQSPFHSPQPPSRGFESQVDFYHTRTESPQYEPEPTTPTTPTHATGGEDIEIRPQTPQGLAPPGTDSEVSRFSWSTYATTTADSPRSIARVMRDSSPPPPVPNLAPEISVRKRNQSPYLHASGAYSTGSVVIRKPVPKKSMTGDRYDSNSKDLPPIPIELEAADKIASMEVQLEALDRRKRNISRILNDLEANLKKNAVVYDMWKRREVERSMSNHQKELDLINQEAHELGMQLHRAQKKRDRDDNYETPTGLWIKRVTS